MQRGLTEMIEQAINLGVGELYPNSIDNDGTGHGYKLCVLEGLEKVVHVPIIMAGGAGNYNHLLEGILHPEVDGVATANLFNFVGNGLPGARDRMLQADAPLARWES